MSELTLLRVVRGEPTAEELAALLVVIAARRATTCRADQARSAWGDPGARLRRPLSTGASAWRRSALPR